MLYVYAVLAALNQYPHFTYVRYNPISPPSSPYSEAPDLGVSTTPAPATLLLSFSFSAAPISASPYQAMNASPSSADTILNVIATMPFAVNLPSS